MAKVAPVNVRDIAARAGVSHITVSRALRDAPNVAPTTKARVQRVAREMGYTPNPLVGAFAAHIRRHRGASTSCTLAWLSGEPLSLQRPWLRPYQVGAARRARELGFVLDESICTENLKAERLAKLIQARGIRGVIIPSLHYFSTEVPEIPGVTTVSLGSSFAARPMHTVSPDTFTNVGTLFSHLLALGYQRIGFCEHRFGAALTQGTAWGAYLFHQQRLPTKNRLPPLVGLGVGRDEPVARKRFAEWIKRYRPDCMVTGFMHARGWLEDMGVSVPDDIGVAHYRMADDTPDWSGIDPFPEAMGAAAVDLLTAHIQRNEYGTPALAKHMKFAGRWVEGQTTRRIRDVSPPKDFDPASHSHTVEWFMREIGNASAGCRLHRST